MGELRKLVIIIALFIIIVFTVSTIAVISNHSVANDINGSNQLNNQDTNSSSHSDNQNTNNQNTNSSNQLDNQDNNDQNNNDTNQSNNQDTVYDKFYIGAGADTWSNLQSLNNQFSLNMNLATTWIASHDDIHGWWLSIFSPEIFWDRGIIPHLITYRYFTNTWGVDYSPASLSLHRQEWLDDLRYMANILKAPNDGNHTVLISLETEFNDPLFYENMDYTYWNQLMIDSRNAIKEIAPNVLVSYSFGGWETRFNNDITMNGALTSSMESMDFMSFQAMWALTGSEETKWLSGDNLKTNYGDVNWVQRYGNKPNVWNYMIDDITNNVKALSKYNSHILLAHLSIDDHLWGTQVQADVVNDIFQNVDSLREMGLFGISWMHYIDNSNDKDGFLFMDGSAKPCLSPWRDLVYKVRS